MMPITSLMRKNLSRKLNFTRQFLTICKNITISKMDEIYMFTTASSIEDGKLYRYFITVVPIE